MAAETNDDIKAMTFEQALAELTDAQRATLHAAAAIMREVAAR